MKRLRLAIVGTGQIAAQAHLPAALACPDVSVAALVDPVADRARTLAGNYGIAPRIAAAAEEIARDVDAAIIATPNHTHRAAALPFLDAGASVLIEKPLATSVADAQEIVDAAERRGAVAAVGYSWRFWDSVVLMKELLEKRWFGRVHRFLHQEGSRGGWSPLSNYNLDRRAVGGGVLVVSGTHFLDRALYWFGYPSETAAADDSEGGPEANSRVELAFETPSGRVEGLVRFSKTTRIENGFVMETERGIVLLSETLHAPIRFRPNDAPGLEMELRRRGAPLHSPKKSMYLMQLEDFVRAVANRTTPMVAAREGLQSVRLLEELYGKRVPLPAGWYAERPREAVVTR